MLDLKALCTSVLLASEQLDAELTRRAINRPNIQFINCLLIFNLLNVYSILSSMMILIRDIKTPFRDTILSIMLLIDI